MKNTLFVTFFLILTHALYHKFEEYGYDYQQPSGLQIQDPK